VVGISLSDHPEILIASGESDMKDHVAIKTGDQFQIASISKTFIAAEVLRLAGEGKIKLDDPLNAYLPGTPHGDIVTIRHLLNHRSGYFDPIYDDPDFIPMIAKDLGKQWTPNEMLALTFQHELFFEPGTGYKYSNTNYLFLGLVIEKITQQTLGQSLTLSFITPLRLEHTQYQTIQTDVQQTSLVHGYDAFYLTKDEYIDTMNIPNTAILSVSNNTIMSNASDLLKWSRALYENNSTFLEPELREQMLTFDNISSYGLGVDQSTTQIGTSIGHSGSTAGYLSLMEYFPKQDMALVILANANSSSIYLGDLRNLLLSTIFNINNNEEIQRYLADLTSEDVSTRKAAISALGHSGTHSEEAIKALISILKEDTNAENRKEAALALGIVGKNSGEVKQTLTDALQDEDASVRDAAGFVLSVLK